jgi:hypothetical protein
MFLQGSDLSPIKENSDKIIYGLTKWDPKTKAKGVTPPQKIRVEGKDYEDAVENMNRLFLKNMWSDGLPIMPPSEERVRWLLRGTDLPRDTVIGKILPRGGIATVETLATVLAMANGRPEYMPVLIAAVEAIIDPQFKHFHMNSTTCAANPAIIVSGPIARQIRINSGYGCLGPSSEYPAGGSIGRAIRFLLMDAGGGTAGIGSMSIYGGASRYTNIVFAEDETGSPWEPLNVERGFPKGSNVVTALPVAGGINLHGVRTTTEETALKTLTSISAYIRHSGNWVDSTYDVPGILLLARNAAGPLGDLGWTKQKVKRFLWDHSKVPLSDLGNYWHKEREERFRTLGYKITDPLPITNKPENFMIVVAGGEQSGHGYWMPVAVGINATSAQIKLPAKWDDLIKQAEKDLGPIPAR